jgi:phage terminase large subunit-like protein
MAGARSNTRKRVADESFGPWVKWRTKARHARAIRFIETYCIAPKGFGAGRPVKLAGFQKEWLEEVLSGGYRAAVESIPRGNGKSTFKAALAAWAVFDPDDTGDPQVPIIASTIKQGTKTIYGPMCRMVESHPDLANRSLRYTALSDAKLLVPSTNGEVFPIAEDPDGLQGLDPSLGLVDEIGFLKIEAWASLLLATGKRPSSLILAIGTPGFSQDSALWHVRENPDPSVHFTEFAGDRGCDVRDETQWEKANPAYVAGFKSRDAFTVALSLPEALFRIFQLGQWVFGVDGWLGTDGVGIWQDLADPYELVPGADTWAAVDMSRTRDSTAVVAVQRRPDGRWHVRSRVWYPERGKTIDGRAVMDHVRQLHRDYRLVSVAYDPRFFEERADLLTAEGIALVEFPQSVERMTGPCGTAFELVNAGAISHDGAKGDPDLQAHVLNAVMRPNARGFTLQKKTADSPDKIDAAVAMVMALAVAGKTKPKPALVVL